MATAISEENFADFYERNYQAVYKICYLFMKNTAEEIAAIKKKTPSTIRNQLSDARKKLKKLPGGDFA